MKVKQGIREKRLNQTKRLYKQISSNNESYKEELFKIIKNSKDLKKDITDAFYSNFTDILSSSLSEIKNFCLKNLMSIYLPTRTEKSNEMKNIILKDSINNLDATFNIESS